MRSWPPQLRSLHPVSRGRNPDRPWWRYVQAKHVWRRTDGLEREAGFDGKFRGKKELLGLLEGRDTIQPLPHPGYRAGQLWAVINDQGDVELLVAIQAHRPHSYRPWLVEAKYIETDKLHRLVEGALLVADISCPWLAPWAPVEAT